MSERPLTSAPQGLQVASKPPPTRSHSEPEWPALAVEWVLILLVIFVYSWTATLDFDPHQLQQTGEQNESATLPILAEIGLLRHGEIPRWNPYMLTGFPHSGDLINHFWNPIATVPVLLFGGVNGMKVSIFLSLLVAAYGQWALAHVFGVRGMFRLWAALLFALSGGIALLSWLGWYELLVGIAWFPASFALWWLALRRNDFVSIVLAAVAIFMILTTGGGYYPLYLGVCLVTLTAFALLWAPSSDRIRYLKRAALVAVLAVGLSAVYFVPLFDSLRLTARDAPPDVNQLTSQPLLYGLFNFVVSDPAWLRADILNKGSSFGWLYIGALPILGLVLLPWLFARAPWRRREIVTLVALLLVLFLWQANRHWPVSLLYETFPILRLWRFPGRLLIVATVPLLVLAAMALQGLLVWARGRLRRAYGKSIDGGAGRAPSMAALLATMAAALLLLISAINVFETNKPLATAPHSRNQTAREILGWLQAQDPTLYYVDIGNQQIYWDWMAYAYELEMPVLNFRYNRRLRSMDSQVAPVSPFRARARYVLLSEQAEAPPGATLLNTLNGVNIWQQDDALPYAFTTAAETGPFDPAIVMAETVRLDGPNRVIVSTSPGTEAGQLIVLVSDYPGWQLSVNNNPVSVQPVNGYLGAERLPGDNVYVFEFRPTGHTVGIVISLLAAAVCVGLLIVGRRRRQ